jgi:hypothetical protein
MLRSPGADLGTHVTISSLPELRPQSLDEFWDLMLAVEFR